MPIDMSTLATTIDDHERDEQQEPIWNAVFELAGNERRHQDAERYVSRLRKTFAAGNAHEGRDVGLAVCSSMKPLMGRWRSSATVVSMVPAR